ncbi:Tyrosine recombinase XerA [Candidatus Bilamarchaeum dharawalense]|uniref:Tyrosine recombinase XerA n=1 Tax=Candidatus Bilamarchaeum dharawalense TaxID=2885759 RepID=A0A5E4LM42_9ARCH|nr:Tyrosine recombinase XerA [Candidatus Bilamarchaeum dharawalense]
MKRRGLVPAQVQTLGLVTKFASKADNPAPCIHIRSGCVPILYVCTKLGMNLNIRPPAGVKRMNGNGFDLYNYPKRLEQSLGNLNKDTSICEENRQAILNFSKIRLAKGSGHGRVAKVVYCLRFLSRWLKKPFVEATRNDLIILVGELESNPKYAEHTKYDYKIVLKMFYKWLKGDDEVFPKEISWLTPKLKNENHKLPEELLSEEEVLKLANTAEHPRDKAFILVLYETGCRIGEILSLRMKNVQFDQYGAILRVTGKTGDRRVRIISSSSTLASWINIHPKANNGDSPLWTSRANNRKYLEKPPDHRSIYVLLKGLAKKAGINKRIYPHLFRHSRATALAGKLTEFQLKDYFGWVPGSDMASVYVHLSGRDVDNALLKLHGLETTEEKKEDTIKVRSCPKCKEHNSPISRFCTKCGMPLDEVLVAKMENERKISDELMNKLMENKKFKAVMMETIVEMGLEKSIS